MIDMEDRFWCDVCGKDDDAPHTPIDHPWLLRGHRLIPKPRVDEMIAVERARVEARERVLREVIEEYHRSGLIRDHHDRSDKTGWNVKGIETCGDPLCVEALALLKE